MVFGAIVVIDAIEMHEHLFLRSIVAKKPLFTDAIHTAFEDLPFEGETACAICHVLGRMPRRPSYHLRRFGASILDASAADFQR
jgi:hypothetical protein